MVGRCLSAGAVLAFALAALPLPVEAGLITQTFVGTIDRADAGNPLGVAVNDTFSLTVGFDPAGAVDGPGGARTFVFAPSDPSFLRLQIGTFTFDEEDDIDFGPGKGFPLAALTTDRMRVASVDLRVRLGLPGRVDELDLIASALGMATLQLVEDAPSGPTTVTGSIRFAPEPQLALGLGLGALVWLRRRRGATSGH